MGEEEEVRGHGSREETLENDESDDVGSTKRELQLTPGGAARQEMRTSLVFCLARISGERRDSHFSPASPVSFARRSVAGEPRSCNSRDFQTFFVSVNRSRRLQPAHPLCHTLIPPIFVHLCRRPSPCFSPFSFSSSPSQTGWRSFRGARGGLASRG